MLVAGTAGALTNPAAVSAVNGALLIIGNSSQSGTTTTGIADTSASQSTFLGIASATTGTGVGLRGDSAADAGTGVWGRATSTTGTTYGVHGETSSATYLAAGVLGTASNGGSGVLGTAKTGYGVRGTSVDGVGIYGSSDSDAGVAGFSAKRVGVSGQSDGPDGIGVKGASSGSGPGQGVVGLTESGDADAAGVLGRAYSSGVGVDASSVSGFALRTSGRLQLKKTSGVATIAAGATSVTVNLHVAVGTSSFVLLTPRANLGGRDLWFTTTTSSTAGTITIHISGSRTSATQISWLLLG